MYLPQIENEGVQGVAPPVLAVARGSETVLLVEDESRLRILMQEILQRNGYTVIPACDGEEALRICRQEAVVFDIVVTDVIMPGMSGPQLADRIQHLRPGTKLLYLSGYTEDALSSHGVLKEGIEFLPKPFPPNTLAAKVRQILDGTPRDVPNP
jgi:DNA-binding response OmpR family regulator